MNNQQQYQRRKIIEEQLRLVRLDKESGIQDPNDSEDICSNSQDDNAPDLKSMAFDYMDNEDYFNAVATFEKALSIEKDYGLYEFLGYSYLELGMNQKALNSFERAAEFYIIKRTWEALYGHEDSYLDNFNLALLRSYKRISEVLRENEDYYWLCVHQATTLMELSKDAEAKEILHEACDFIPGSLKDSEYGLYAYELLGDLES
jgi:tetratricopeptide (TPR) repeat protein